jgi:molecular chaperone DnaJ
VLGDAITVPTVEGERTVELPPGTQPGRQIRMHGLGVPHVRSGRRGDQICVVRVVVPQHLSHQERALYEQLGGRSGQPVEVKRGFFDSLRDALRG